MKKKLKNIIDHLKIRREMYLIDRNSYPSFVSFLMGYSIGIKADEENNILDDFHDWLEIKEGKNFSLNWSSYILNELCNGDEDHAIGLTLDLMTEFTDND